jgi:hypothetical protein
LKRLVAAIAAAVLTLPACTKDDAPSAAGAVPAAEAPAKPAGPEVTQVANFPVAVELPASAVANDPMGSPGFHSEDESISVLIGKQTPDSPKDLKASKQAIEEFAFKKWVKSEQKPDGWVVTWIGVGMDMDGKEYENFLFEQVKTIGADTWRCAGSVKKAAQVDANLKLCASLKAAD